MHFEESKQVLRNSHLFQDLHDTHLDLVLMTCEELNYQSGEIIFHQDDPGDALYIIARGEVEIILETEDEEKPMELAVLKEHDTFGEAVLIEEGARSATARCRTNVSLVRLPRKRLLQTVEDYPEIGFYIMRRMAADLMEKLRTANLNIRRVAGQQSMNFSHAVA
ncbi:MAG: cyclic nucleotide-binding domain-containing protein [Anaerolineae bacterium]